MPTSEAIVLIDSKPYHLAKDAVIQRVTADEFADDDARRGLSSRLRRWTQTTPWGVGLLNAAGAGETKGRVYDEENVLSVWPGRLTLGPLKHAPTWGGPGTFTVPQGGGFAEVLDTIFIFGAGSSDGDEPVHYWIGGGASETETWTDATLNADITPSSGDNPSEITGMAQVGDTAYAISPDNITMSTAVKTFKSTDKTTWARMVQSGTNETFTGTPTPNKSKFLVEFEGSLITAAYVDSTKVIQLQRHTTATATGAWSLDLGGGSNIGTIEESTRTPRALVKWHDAALAQDLFVGTNKGLFWVDVSASTISKIVTFRNLAVHTGQLVVGPDDALYFTDGPNIGRFQWTANGSEVYYVGPHSLDDPANSGTQWDGLPADLDGSVTCLTSVKTKPWIVFAKGGQAGGKNARIGIYNVLTKTFHWPYRYSETANAVIQQVFHSSEDDSIDRLHFVEEASAGGDQNLHFLGKITVNPSNDDSYEFGSTGKVTTYWFDDGSPETKKAFLTAFVTAEGLTASNETVKFKFGFDGGSLGSQLTVNSNTDPPRVFTDGANAVGTSGHRIQMEIELNSAGDDDLSPAVLATSLSYIVKPLKEDGTAREEFVIPIDIATTRNLDGFKSNHQVISNLIALQEATTLTTLVWGPETGGINTKVIFDPSAMEILGPTGNPISQGETPATVQLRAREVV
jgi:hypothetical protein